MIVRDGPDGERIPLTIVECHREDGSVTIVFQTVGASTIRLGRMTVGESLHDVVGPLGTPSDIDQYGTVVCVAGGFGAASVYPIARALKHAGNRVVVVLGGRSRDHLVFRDRLLSVSDRLILTTDDGSDGIRGLVTDGLARVFEDERIDRVIAIGPAVMMRAVADMTRSIGVPTVVSLNPIMVDGTGMCGACRVVVDVMTRFGCVDGPEFDGHRVDWDLLETRLGMYCSEESTARERATTERR